MQITDVNMATGAVSLPKDPPTVDANTPIPEKVAVVPPEEPIKTPPSRLISPETLKATAKLCSWVTLGTSRWLVYLTVLVITPLLCTPLGNSLLNKAARGLGIAPPGASKPKEDSNYSQALNFDPFFDGLPSSKKIKQDCAALEIPPGSMGKLESSQEVDRLKARIKSKQTNDEINTSDTLTLLEEYKTLNKLTWGENDNGTERLALNPEWLCSKESGLNPLMSMLLKSNRDEIKPEHVEGLKRMLKIREYNLSDPDEHNRYITYEIDMFYGPKHLATVRDLKNPRIIDKARNIDEPCKAPFVIPLANQIFKNMNANDAVRDDLIPIPDYSNHYVIRTWVLSDSQLENILRPNKIYPAFRFEGSGKLSENLCFVYTNEDGKLTSRDQYGRTNVYENLSEFRSEVKLIVLEPDSVPNFNLLTLIIFGGAIPLSVITHIGTKYLSRRLYPKPPDLPNKSDKVNLANPIT